jgi:hypothetical protein
MRDFPIVSCGSIFLKSAVVADGDQAIPPDAERLFARRMSATTVEVPTNHVAMVSHPDDVVKLIETAAQGHVGVPGV